MHWNKMKVLGLLITFLLLETPVLGQDVFRESQLRYPRVRQAYAEKWNLLEQEISHRGIKRESLELYLVAYKHDQILEVWGRNRGDRTFELLKSYDICATSGALGPKRRQGDGQVPEGFYHVQIFNPSSNFHLSLGINYPNKSDLILSDRDRPGGDIFIHGSCVTIGCIPITDERIKELYLLCVESRNNGQEKIPVTIYPARMEQENQEILEQAQLEDSGLVNLWGSLQSAYDYFQESHSLPSITFLPDGGHQVH